MQTNTKTDQPTRIADIGEFPLIDRLAEIVSTDHPDVIVGIGDDVAVLNGGESAFRLATIDAQVEDVHYLRQVIPPQKLGRRALTINLSDIAAMGGTPEYALVSLVLPSDTEVEWIEAVYRGMRNEADRYGVALVGGNVARAPKHAVLDVCVLGYVAREHLLLRSGARPGDRVLVTGALGESTAGLRLVRTPTLSVAPEEHDHLLARLFTPTPRLSESAAIARTQRATAMIDLSDGLSSDVGHICERSDVGVRLWVERLPIPESVRHVADQTGEPAWDLALSGGEDFELCFTVPPDAVDEVVDAVKAETGTRVTVVGEIWPAGEGRRLVLEDGREVPLEARGWQHFSRE